ncbi:hypothetical protein DYB34_008716 [Aphanomyces astaci]|uniref:Uncharacterized protein n=1 Tax=Aphanomyces astaci TaxID=112090 RepID=A0A397AHJ6_APHAT|nr:hypothetical protein DYB36_006989 [Aphanomyces astaci]RHY73181.1 hypothetical protein DYB34_008716 [Aphanomyces astaci]RHZ08875.1 hypothetical protein DYB31_008787 [Aphanomyces astaci]
MDNQLFHNVATATSSHHHPMLLPKLDAMTLHASPSSSDFACLYKTNKCRNLRGVKRDGTLHRLCNDHREKANESQRKSETKKRSKQTSSQGAFNTHHLPQYNPSYSSYNWDKSQSYQNDALPSMLHHHWDDTSDSTSSSHSTSPSSSLSDVHVEGSSRRMTLDYILASHTTDYDDDSGSCCSLDDNNLLRCA